MAKKADPVKLIPDKYSLDQDWIQWHKSMKSYLGKPEANRLFLARWQKQAGYGSNASTSALIDYMEGNGVDLPKSTMQSIGGILGDLGGIVKKVAIGAGVVLGIYVIYKGTMYYRMSRGGYGYGPRR
jgi:hypothetical protein